MLLSTGWISISTLFLPLHLRELSSLCIWSCLHVSKLASLTVFWFQKYFTLLYLGKQMLSISENKSIILMPKCRLEQFLSTTFQFISPFHPASLPYVDFLQWMLWKHGSITAQAPLSQLMTSAMTTFYRCWQFIHISYKIDDNKLHVLG